MLIVLVVAGVIASLTIPVLIQSTNNTDAVLYKSAYRLVENVVNELVQDVGLYPDGQLDNSMCANFTAKVNTIGAINCGASAIPASPNFTTSNGMRWYGFQSIAFPNTATANATLYVDINGAKLPNATNRDILSVQIFKSGKVSVPAANTTEIGYLNN